MNEANPGVHQYNEIARERRRILAHAVCYRRAGKLNYGDPADPCPCSSCHYMAQIDGAGILPCPGGWDTANKGGEDPLAITRTAYRQMFGVPFWLAPR